MLARPVAMVFVCMVSLISVNLFLASMTHSYLTVRQDSRSLRENTEHKSLQQQLAELRMDAQLGEDGGDGPKYSFPMHRKCTPTCKDIANSSKFEAFMVQIIVLNVIVLMMDSYDAKDWVKEMVRDFGHFHHHAFGIFHRVVLRFGLMYGQIWAGGMGRGCVCEHLQHGDVHQDHGGRAASVPALEPQQAG